MSALAKQLLWRGKVNLELDWREREMKGARCVAVSVVCFSCLLSSPPQVADGAIEAPSAIQASSLLPPPNVSGSNCVIDEAIVNDGFENRFVLKTSYGTLVVEGQESTAETR